MAYQHFVDLAAKEYAQADRQHCHSLDVHFQHFGIGHDSYDTYIYLDRTKLRIKYSDTCYKEPADDSFKRVEMFWRTDEIGNVVFEVPDFTEKEEHCFNEVLDMFGGDKRIWLLVSLRICYRDREAITYSA